MLKTTEKCLIDAIDIGEVKIDLISNELRNGLKFPGITVTARYALVISKTGTRLGAGTRVTWNEQTQEKIRELLAAMEQDIGSDVFGQPPTTDGSEVASEHPSDDVPQL